MAILAHPANVDPEVQRALSRWLDPMPALSEDEIVAGSLGASRNSRLEKILTSGKGPLLRKLLGLEPQASQGALFSFEELKDILRDSRKVKTLEELSKDPQKVRKLSDLLTEDPTAGGFTGESKGQTSFDFKARPTFRETVTPDDTGLTQKASPPDMVGPDVHTVPGRPLRDQARWIEGGRGRFSVRDKLFGDAVLPETRRPVDALSEAVEAAQEYNTTGLSRTELRGFLEKRLPPKQMKAVAAKLLRPRAGIDEVRYHATGRLFEQGKVLPSELMAGKNQVPGFEGKMPKITTALIDEIRNKLGGFNRNDTPRMAGQDVLAGMNKSEQKTFIAGQKEAAKRAKMASYPTFIHRELEDTGELAASPTQQTVDSLMRQYRNITQGREVGVPGAAKHVRVIGGLNMNPDELMAGVEAGPGRAASRAAFEADKVGIVKKLRELDAMFASSDPQTWSIATKFGEAIVQENPDITRRQLLTTMPNLTKHLQYPRPGQSQGQAIAQFGADSAYKSARETDASDFMAGEVEDARAAARMERGNVAGKPNLEVLPAGKAPPKVDKQVAETVAKRDLLRRILPSSFKNKDDFLGALERAKTAAPDATNVDVPMPTKETLARLSPDEQKALLALRDQKIAALKKNAFTNPADFDVEARRHPTFQGVVGDGDVDDVDWLADMDADDAWNKQVQSGRRGQSQLERLSRKGRPRDPGAAALAMELGDAKGGLPPHNQQALEKLVKKLRATAPGFENLTLADVMAVRSKAPVGPPTMGEVARGALQHRDAAATQKLAKALKLVEAGKSEEALAGLGANLQKIIKMFITKL